MTARGDDPDGRTSVAAALATTLCERFPRLAELPRAAGQASRSAREIVSRLLKSFAERGWASLGREKVQVRDVGSLRRLAV